VPRIAEQPVEPNIELWSEQSSKQQRQWLRQLDQPATHTCHKVASSRLGGSNPTSRGEGQFFATHKHGRGLTLKNATPCISQEEISPDVISEHYMNVARRLTQRAPSRAASPHPSPNTRRTTSPKEAETETTGDSALAVPPPLSISLDWWTLQSSDGPLTLDELPDSELCYLPEYQLTQEWFERIISELAEADEEKRVEGELEVDMGAEMTDLDVETVGGIEAQGSSRAQLGRQREQ